MNKSCFGLVFVLCVCLIAMGCGSSSTTGSSAPFDASKAPKNVKMNAAEKAEWERTGGKGNIPTFDPKGMDPKMAEEYNKNPPFKKP